MLSSGLPCYTCITCMSGMQCYTQVWFEFLYLHPLWILLGFTKLIESVLYLLLVCNIIPTSVMATFAFTKLEFRLVIPISGTGQINIIPSSVISTYGAPFICVTGAPIIHRCNLRVQGAIQLILLHLFSSCG